MDLYDTAAVVTGGGHGIGRALCLALAAEGVNVAVADIDENAAQSVAEELKSYPVKAIGVEVDVSSADSVHNLAENAIANFGNVELLFNNAGVVAQTSTLIESSPSDAEWIFRVNVFGTLNCIWEFAPRFQKVKRKARIINTASEHALGVPHVGSGLYTASKHAILGLSDVLRYELPDHIGISVLCPGFASTSLWRAVERRQKQFGGPSAGNQNTGQFMQQLGMSAEEIAAKTMAGIKRDDFYIFTHSHSVEFSRERWHEIRQVFFEHEPRQQGDERYNLRELSLNAGRFTSNDPQATN